MKEYDILNEILPNLDPARLDYQSWLGVGMALKDGGYSASDWDNWSRRDAARYHPGECARKWGSFTGSGVGVGTIVQYARDQGWTPPSWDGEISFDDTICEERIIDPDQLELSALPVPEQWRPGRELARYLELLFEPAEIVGYVTGVWWSDTKQRWLPQKGTFSRTAGELIEALSRHPDDPGAVIGDCRPEAGAWIRFNPLDGVDVRNDNVTEYRYALVESDCMPVEQQYAVIRELELPAKVVVHSGGKSIHAIVHIGASSYEEYRRRVDYLYKICEKNGLKIDSQNRNPSRLSRMPGVMRGENRQYIVAENIGRSDFNEWQEWVESVTDDLPGTESLADVWNNMPALAPPLIENVLRQGHKMLLAGPSKAGKSFALIELCIAIAEGRKWMGFGCTQGRVLYVNLELDSASCWNRIRDVYTAMGIDHPAAHNFDVWNLRGKSVPMDKLAPKLIRRAARQGYIAIVIDPIYKVITGDENSADQMAKFCNQFDLVCTELGCAVIYCHHHSKGLQGQKKSMDRASGSGVFARDPDAMLDMIELTVSEDLKKAEGDRAALEVCKRFLRASATVTRWQEYFSQDDLCSLPRTLTGCQKLLSEPAYAALLQSIDEARRRSDKRTAWRIEGTLREFERFAPRNVWFDYPSHTEDEAGCLQDIDADSDTPPWQRATKARKKQADSERTEKNDELEKAIANANGGEPPSISDVAQYLGVAERTVRDRLKAHKGYVLDKNKGVVVAAATSES